MDQNKLFSPQSSCLQPDPASYHLSGGLIASERQQLRLSPSPSITIIICLCLPAQSKKSRPSTVIDILIAAEARNILAKSVSQPVSWNMRKFSLIQLDLFIFKGSEKRLIFCIVRPDYPGAGRTDWEVRAELSQQNWGFYQHLNRATATTKSPHWFANVWTHF